MEYFFLLAVMVLFGALVFPWTDVSILLDGILAWLKEGSTACTTVSM